MFWLRYVPHAKQAAYEAQGWRLVGNGHLAQTTHGFWSVLMRWDGAEAPPAL